jgi:hypothetical protein
VPVRVLVGSSGGGLWWRRSKRASEVAWMSSSMVGKGTGAVRGSHVTVSVIRSCREAHTPRIGSVAVLVRCTRNQPHVEPRRCGDPVFHGSESACQVVPGGARWCQRVCREVVLAIYLCICR